MSSSLSLRRCPLTNEQYIYHRPTFLNLYRIRPTTNRTNSNQTSEANHGQLPGWLSSSFEFHSAIYVCFIVAELSGTISLNLFLVKFESRNVNDKITNCGNSKSLHPLPHFVALLLTCYCLVPSQRSSRVLPILSRIDKIPRKFNSALVVTPVWALKKRKSYKIGWKFRLKFMILRHVVTDASCLCR